MLLDYRMESSHGQSNIKVETNLERRLVSSALLYAGAEGLLETVKLAVEAGADTTLTNRYGGTGHIPASNSGHCTITFN